MAWPPPVRLSGASLRAVAALSTRKSVAALLKRTFASQLGIDRLATLGMDARAGLPAEARPIAARPPRALAPSRAAAIPAASWPVSGAALQAGYAAGSDNPRDAVERAFAAARALAARTDGAGPLLAFDDTRARADADAATRRFAARRPLGPLDGVPFVVKEETDLAGFSSRVGTEIFGDAPAQADATVVARLRAAGAIALGQTAMTELGLSPFGVNPHRAMPRNPHHPGRVAGGSSTGSAVSVATGICPVAVAADGGGSIRIPASLCGVFGLKPTFGRVSRGGDFYRGTMNHLGPIGATPADLAHFLDAVAGPDPADPITSWAAPPAGAFSAALASSVRGLKIGVLEWAWEDAAPRVAAHGRAALAALEAAGATLAPVSIPLAPYAPPIGYLSIGLEEAADLAGAPPEVRAKLAADVRMTLAALGAFGSTDYLDAQRLRARLREQTAAAFATFDLLALPAASIAAPPITDAESASGIVDSVGLHGLCRTMMLGNLTGLPGGVAPVGADDDGLPVGVQLMGDAWDEAAVIAALAELERAGVARAVEPKLSARSVS